MVNYKTLSAVLDGLDSTLDFYQEKRKSDLQLAQKNRQLQQKEEEKLYRRLLDVQKLEQKEHDSKRRESRQETKDQEKEEDRKRREKDRQINLKSKELKLLESEENKFLSKIPFVKDLVGDPRKKELKEELHQALLEAQGYQLNDEKDTTENTLPLIEQLRLQHVLEQQGDHQTKKKPKNKIFIRTKGKAEEHLTDEEYEQGQRFLKWFTGGSLLDALKSVPSGALEIGEGTAGLVGAKKAKQKIRDLKESYEDMVGVDRDNAMASLGRFGGEFIPLGGLGKLGKLIPGGAKVAKMIPRGVKTTGAGALYGAVEAEKNDEDPIEGAKIGGALALGTHLVGKGATKLKKNQLNRMKNRAKISNPEEIIARSEVMGKEALIPEIVGDEKYINRLKKDTSKSNYNRMEKVETNIRNHAKNVSDKLPQNRDIELYETLEKMSSNAKEKGAQLYDITKESGIGRHGVLEKPFVEEWVNIIKEYEPHVKGLPSMKPGASKNAQPSPEALQWLLQRSPGNFDAYKKFAIENQSSIPTPTDFLKFRGKVGKMLEKADSTNVDNLTELYRRLNDLVEKVDVNSNLSRARHNWATEVAPFSEKPIKEAREAVKFSDRLQGRPSVSEVFGKKESAKAFERLSTQDKEKVLGGFLEEILEREEVSPERAIQELWKKLPDHVKRSNDSHIQKLLKQIRAQGHLNKTTSSLQQATTSSIGSRIAVGAKKLRQPIHAYSLLTGDLTPSAVIGTTELGLKGANSARRKAFRKRMGQNNLKYYLKPELLDEVIKNNKFKHRHRLPIAILNEDPQGKRENMIE